MRSWILILVVFISLNMLLSTHGLSMRQSEWINEVKQAQIEAQNYCNTPWPTTPSVGAPVWQKPKRPLILISGIAGTMLHSPLGTFPETWKKLWISFRTQDEIALTYLSGKFNGSEIEERYGHKIVPRDDGDGLCSIDCLDPDLIVSRSDSDYYHDMIYYLISIGYTPGINLFGMPYDWRQSVRNPATLEKLHSLIHRLHIATKQPIDLISHSMGGLVVKSYVSRYMEDLQSVLGTWTAIGTPWRGGGAVAYKALISGYSLDMTTIPIVNWGLSEAVAHAVEVNWPSVFELLPDLQHDPWWLRSDPSPPSISYQILGRSPATADTPSAIRSLLTDVNAKNMEVFPPVQAAVPNPINTLAWDHADTTHLNFNQLSQKMAAYKKTNPRSTFKVFSFDGSALPTHYSLNLNKAAIDPPGLQKVPAKFIDTKGDGTVPYSSALSDGIGAIHMEYSGPAEHQRLLRAPEIFQGLRTALGLNCLLEGSWRGDIYDPNGNIFASRMWYFNDSSALLFPPKLTTIADQFNLTLPDGAQLSGTFELNCMKFVGIYYTGFKVVGTRLLGPLCYDSNEINKVEIENGYTTQTCIYGYWSTKKTVYCNEGFHEAGGSCVKNPPPTRGGNRNLIIIVSTSVVVLILVTIGAVLLIRKIRSKKNEYRVVPMDDGLSLHPKSAMANSVLADVTYL